jgi:tetratricopeptide (TPR) repeat protein
MKKYFLVATAMLSVLAVNAQKDELKAASKALKKGDAATAIQALNPIAEVAKSADDKTKANFYALYGQASLQLAQTGEGDYDPAIESYEAIVEMNDSKYIEEAKKSLKIIKDYFFEKYAELQSENNFKDAATYLYNAYQVDKIDTLTLFYAAASSYNAKDYVPALKYFQELKDIGYDGSTMSFKATNIETNEVESFGSNKAQRDLLVRANTYKDPIDELEPSKKKDIILYIAQIHSKMDKPELSIQVYQDAVKEYPEDVDFRINLAYSYYQTGDTLNFGNYLKEAIELDPYNADLNFNIGVISMDNKDYPEARKYFDKALEINPNYANALINKSSTFIEEGNILNEKQNALKLPFTKDAPEYNRLQVEKEKLFRRAAEVIEKELERFKENKDCLDQLQLIYYRLDDEDNRIRIEKLKEAIKE